MKNFLVKSVFTWLCCATLSCNLELINGDNYTLSLLYPFTDVTEVAFIHYIGAFKMAIEAVNNDSAVNNHDINLLYTIEDTNSNSTTKRMTTLEKEEESIRIITERSKVLVGRSDAFVGPGLESCTYPARVAASFDKPLIGYRCKDVDVSNKEKFPTFGRTVPSDSNIGPPIVGILKRYNWKRLAVICDQNDRSLQVKDDLIIELAVKYTVSFDDVFEENKSESYYEKYFKKLKENARIIVYTLRESNFGSTFIYQASKHGLDNGDYVLIMVDTNENYKLDTEGYYPERTIQISWGGNVHKILTDFYNDKPKLGPAVSMLNHTFLMASWTGDIQEYNEFQNKVKKITGEIIGCEDQKKRLQCGVLYSDNVPGNAWHLYNAVTLYYKALLITKYKGNDTRNGKVVMDNAKWMRFISASGLDVTIDDSLDQLFNFTLLSLQPSNNYMNVTDDFLDWFPFGSFSYVGSSMQQLQSPSEIPTWESFPPPDAPQCGFFGELCIKPTKKPSTTDNMTAIIVGAVFGALIIAAIYAALYIYRRRLLLANMNWKIEEKEIHVTSKGLDASKMSLNGSTEGGIQLFTQVAMYKSQLVAVKQIEASRIVINRPKLEELRDMLELSHENINPFLGLVLAHQRHMIVFQYCQKGSLQDVLGNDEIQLDAMFLTSFVRDIVKGMIYLHSSSIKSHGRLKSCNCIVDSRWMVKITDYGSKFLTNGLAPLQKVDNNAYYKSLLWTAPELLRLNCSLPKGTQKGDVYSFGIILQEIITRSEPYAMHELDAIDIIQKVTAKSDPPFRPAVKKYHARQSMSNQSGQASTELYNLMLACLSEEPDHRLTFQESKKVVRKLSHGKEKNVFEHMANMLSTYSNHLEKVVEDRTKQLIEEKKKTDDLVHRMLPKFIAEQLKQSNYVEAEWYDEVTIYFSDIVGFTTISGMSTPMQVVDLLNDLYTLFDAIISNYDAYKVETIGDAYMVVSGLPIRNGHAHVIEIAELSLHLLHAVENQFVIRHMPDTKLQIRIGLHSGPVAAGVVGTTMPRYCLFGDTVNKASRMESNGKALKIHISRATKDLLELKGIYRVEPREEKVELKNVGVVQTYWLTGKHDLTSNDATSMTGKNSHSSIIKSTSSNKIATLITPVAEDSTVTPNGLIKKKKSFSSFNPLRRGSNLNFMKKKSSITPNSLV